MPTLKNRVIVVNGRRTSMRMCKKEWAAFEQICFREKLNRNDLLGMIEEHKSPRLGLTYSTRLFILCYYQEAATNAGHEEAGHNAGDRFQTLKNIICSALQD